MIRRSVFVAVPIFSLFLLSCKSENEPPEKPVVYQWETLDIPASNRYDDAYFVNANEGWTAGGAAGTIYHTTNGGNSWERQLLVSKYLRSIEFLDSKIGLCGSVDGALYRTTDGGKTWTDISANIGNLPGICGIAGTGSSIVYAAGIWSTPGYIIKSEDYGLNWSKIDMSAYADAMIDLYFFNKDVGLAAGRSINPSEGGIILSTQDGGKNWSIVHKTGQSKDYVWKIQTPDGQNFYASIDARSGTGKTRILHSADKGLTWNTLIVSDNYYNLQGVGFITPQKGWAGGGNHVFETSDGGKTWKEAFIAKEFNRFFKINNDLAYLSGSKIYKYSPSK